MTRTDDNDDDDDDDVDRGRKTQETGETPFKKRRKKNNKFNPHNTVSRIQAWNILVEVEYPHHCTILTATNKQSGVTFVFFKEKQVSYVYVRISSWFVCHHGSVRVIH